MFGQYPAPYLRPPFDPGYMRRPRYPRWHDTSHYHYHPGRYVRHGDHFHFVPGHLHRHNTGHWHR